MCTLVFVDSRQELIEQLRTLMQKANVGPNWVAKKVNVSHTTVSHHLDGKAKRETTNKQWIPLAIAALKEKLDQQENVIRELISPYDVKDKEPQKQDASFLHLLHRVRRKVQVISMGKSWRDDEVQLVEVITNPMMASSEIVIMVKEDTYNLTKGMAIAFIPFDYPEPGKWLLFQSQKDAQEKVFGFIDGNDPTNIQTGSKPVPLSEWTVIGMAFSIAWGPGNEKLAGIYNPQGLGPMSRIG